MKRGTSLAPVAVLLGAATIAASPAWCEPAPLPTSPVAEQSGDSCGKLAGLQLDQVDIESARTQIAGGPVAGAGNAGTGLPAFCRVIGHIRPEAGSDIGFEVWLPSANWDGRLNGAGTGGFAGPIAYKDLAAAVRAGQVGASTDTGHMGNGMESAWAKGHPERVRDYGWRAIHLTAVTAKKLIAALYGRGPDRSYFMSCSNGGRQALMEASRFPEDYDGIIAGAPAAPFTKIVLSMINTVQAQLPPGAAIRSSQAKFLQAEVLRQCDGLDGQADGLVADPRQCKVDVSKLACTGDTSPQCFAPAQLEALRRIYAGPRDSRGRQLAAGYPLSGAEMGMPAYLGWDLWIFQGPGPKQHEMLSGGLLRDLPPAPIATPQTFDFDRDPARVKAALADDLDPKPDLRRFFDRGGKLIMYHGWADAAVPPQNSLDFRKAVLAASGPKAKASMRLFMVPAMQHCFAGPGPWSFGQTGAPQAGDTPDRNVASAIQAWVESGRVPESVVGQRGTATLSGMLAADGTLGEGRHKERLICAYPARPQLDRGGDPDKASAYGCRSTRERK